MSNRDRIARAAAEAEATRTEKGSASEPKPAAKKPAAKKAKAVRAGTRIAWAVCDQTGSTVEVFAYPQEAEARAEAKKRTEATGKTHFVKRAEVP